MKKLLIVLAGLAVCLAAVGGCKQKRVIPATPDQQILGTWHWDLDNIDVYAPSEAMKKSAEYKANLDMIKDRYKNAYFTFRADHTVEGGGNGPVSTGKWELVGRRIKFTLNGKEATAPPMFLSESGEFIETTIKGEVGTTQMRLMQE